MSAIHFAAMSGHVPSIKKLLANVTYANSKALADITPMHLVAAAGHPSAINALLDHGANINARMDSGWSPLHLAVMQNKAQAVDVLLANSNIDVDAKGINDMTPLHVGLSYEADESVIINLIQNGANVNATATGLFFSLLKTKNKGKLILHFNF